MNNNSINIFDAVRQSAQTEGEGLQQKVGETVTRLMNPNWSTFSQSVTVESGSPVQRVLVLEERKYVPQSSPKTGNSTDEYCYHPVHVHFHNDSSKSDEVPGTARQKQPLPFDDLLIEVQTMRKETLEGISDISGKIQSLGAKTEKPIEKVQKQVSQLDLRVKKLEELQIDQQIKQQNPDCPEETRKNLVQQAVLRRHNETNEQSRITAEQQQDNQDLKQHVHNTLGKIGSLSLRLSTKHSDLIASISELKTLAGHSKALNPSQLPLSLMVLATGSYLVGLLYVGLKRNKFFNSKK
jgi:hypothetical protein